MDKIINKYVFEYAAESESPRQYHRWCFIAAIAARLGRRVYLPFGFGTIYPNMYVMLIGSPGARKSSAIKAAVNLLRASGYKKFSASKTTKEKFLLDMHEQMDEIEVLESPEDSEVLIAADEFTNFVGAGNYEFISLLGELWDCPDFYENRVKNSKSYTIHRPVVNLISGNTPTGLAAALPPEMVGQGFLSRLLLIYGERTDKRITIPKVPNGQIYIDFLSQLEYGLSGEVSFEAEAFDAVDKLYKNWKDMDDYRLHNYSTRRLTHLLKLVIVCAAMRMATRVILEDVVMANTILHLAELDMPKALGEYGKSKYGDVATKVVDVCLHSELPLSISDIWKHVSTDLEKVSQLQEILANLIKADKIQSTNAGFLPVRRSVDENTLYFDPTLIGEKNANN